MDVDARARMRMFAHDARHQRNAQAQEFMRDAVHRDGIKTGIREDDLHLAARGGIAFIPGAHVFAKHLADVAPGGEKGVHRLAGTGIAIGFAPLAIVLPAFVGESVPHDVVQRPGENRHRHGARGVTAFRRRAAPPGHGAQRQQQRHQIIQNGMNRGGTRQVAPDGRKPPARTDGTCRTCQQRFFPSGPLFFNPLIRFVHERESTKIASLAATNPPRVRKSAESDSAQAPRNARAGAPAEAVRPGLSRFFLGIIDPDFLKDGSCSLFSRLDTRE